MFVCVCVWYHTATVYIFDVEIFWKIILWTRARAYSSELHTVMSGCVCVCVYFTRLNNFRYPVCRHYLHKNKPRCFSFASLCALFVRVYVPFLFPFAFFWEWTNSLYIWSFNSFFLFSVGIHTGGRDCYFFPNSFLILCRYTHRVAIKIYSLRIEVWD